MRQRLARNAGPARRRKAGLEPLAPKALLSGRIFDDADNGMIAVSARKGSGRIYRYYVSSALQQGRKSEAGSLARIPAPALEDLVRDRLSRLGAAMDDVRRIEVGRRRLVLHLDAAGLQTAHVDLPATDRIVRADHTLTLTIAASMCWRGGAKVAVGPDGAPATCKAQVDLPLLRALVKAETWKIELLGGGLTMNALADREGVNRAYAQRVIRLAWLSPALKRAIIDGATPAGLSLKRLLQEDIPIAWSDQMNAWRASAA